MRSRFFFLLTQKTSLNAPLRYLEHVRKVYRKFSRGLWKKVSAPKMGFCQNIPTWFWASFFENLNFFHFFWHIIRLVRRVVTIFLLTQKTRLTAPFRYLADVRKPHSKFSTSIWKKVSPQKMRFCQNILTWFQTIFWQNFIIFVK